MTVSQGSVVNATDYNSMRTTVNSILNTSFGQPIGTTAVTGFDTQGLNASSVTATDLSLLFLDIQKVHVHQTGSINSSFLAPIVANTIGANESLAYNQSTGATSSVTNGTLMGYNDFIAAVNTISAFDGSVTGWPVGNFALGTTTTSTRTQAWGGTPTPSVQRVFHVVTFTFPSSTVRDNYFNAGGELRFSASLTSPSGTKATDWANMLTALGTIRFNKYRSTAPSGTPGAGGSGYDSLTSTYRTLFTRNGSGVYSTNQYLLEGRIESATVLRFRITLNDANAGGTDENVVGTTSSSVTTFRPNSSFNFNSVGYTAVNIAAPTIATQTELTANLGTPPA